MPSTILAAALAVSLHTCLGAVPASVSPPADSTAKSPVKKNVYDKGKGTVGFISGLLLGPVGLGGVYLFSHNHAQRKAAKKGCTIFGIVVVTAAFCWLVFLGVKDLGGSASSGSSRSGGGGRSGGSGGSGRSGGSGGNHSANTGWANNINLPDFGSPCPPAKKKPAVAQPPVEVLPTIFIKY
ncbi:MAG TPA: hypothetical protein VNV35_16230 [Puia sp.]|nr:hypothetical protein [Puia sp.]